MKQRAAVTGLGAVSSFGLGVSALWDGLCAGASAVAARPQLLPVGLAELPLGLVTLPEDVKDPARALLSSHRRALSMSAHAAAEALADAAWPDAGARPGPGTDLRLGLCIGTTLGEKAPWAAELRRLLAPLSPSISEDRGGGADSGAAAASLGSGYAVPAQWLARRYAAQRVRVVSAACASSNAALGVALHFIRSGLCDAVLCGGVDALQEFVLSGFLALRAHALSPCRPFDRERAGLNLGEGAAFLLLEAETRARARGRRIRAYLDGSGLSCDANHMTGPDREGRGATRALRAALQDAELPATGVDFISAHGTATRFNDSMEARAFCALLGERSRAVPVNSIKGAIGHSLGAAGALEAVMAVRVLEEQRIPPTAGHKQPDPEIPLDIVSGSPRSAKVRSVLSTSSGFGGLNAAVLFRSAAAPAPGGSL